MVDYEFFCFNKFMFWLLCLSCWFMIPVSCFMCWLLAWMMVFIKTKIYTCTTSELQIDLYICLCLNAHLYSLDVLVLSSFDDSCIWLVFLILDMFLWSCVLTSCICLSCPNYWLYMYILEPRAFMHILLWTHCV